MSRKGDLIYVCFKNRNKDNLKFILDTGATISVIRGGVVKDVLRKSPEIIEVTGVGGAIKTGGKVEIEIFGTNKGIIIHSFHILDAKCLEFADGILGADFLLKHKGIINYEKLQFSYMPEETRIETKLFVRNRKVYKLAAKQESWITVPTDLEGDVVVESLEIGDGIYTARIITKAENGKVEIKVLNTRNEAVLVQNVQPKLEKIENFEVAHFEQPKGPRMKEIAEKIDFSGVGEREKSSMEKLLEEYEDIFYLEGDPLSTTNVCKASIKLKQDSTPVFRKQYRQAHAHKEIIQEKANEMVKSGVAEPSTSSWSAPMLAVPKKTTRNGKVDWRIVIDYRELNKQVEDDKFPIPLITDILDSLGKCVYFSTLDLTQGYYQVELEDESRPCTAFSTANQHYQLTRLPMGLKTSPAQFSRIMSLALSGLTQVNCWVYLDDILIFGNSLENHNKNLKQVLERLRETNLKLKPEKCKFLRKEIVYLGHKITNKGILPDPEKTLKIETYPKPKNCDDVRRFVAFTNYYRRFIKDFSSIALPLNRLLKKNAVFEWNEDCELAFQTFRKALMTPPLLQYPDFTNQFVVQCDASGFALGATLSNSDNRPIVFASRKMNQAEMRYIVMEQELLAVVWAVKVFRPYLLGRRFTIKTDHRPLIYLYNMQPRSNRLTKFRIALQEYDFDIEYVKGKENSAADALSRIRSEDLEMINVTTRSMQKKTEESKEENKKEKSTEKEEERESMKSTLGSDQPKMIEMLKKPQGVVEIKIFNKLKEIYKAKDEEDIVCGKNLNVVYKIKENFLCIRNPVEKEFDADLDALKTEIDKERERYGQEKKVKSDKDKKIEKVTTKKDKEAKIDRKEEIIREMKQVLKRIGIQETFIYKSELRKLKSKEKNNEEATEENFLEEITKEVNLKIYWVNNSVKVISEKEQKEQLLKEFHDWPTAGHPGEKKMYTRIKKYYFWPNLGKDVEMKVKTCKKCQINKHSKLGRVEMSITDTAQTSFDKIYLDLVGPMKMSEEGFQYALTVQDDLSKFLEIVPLKSKETIEVAKALVEEFFMRYGIAKEVVSDLGKEFISEVFTETCKFFGTQKRHSTPYHHQSIGALENSHKSLNAYLRSYAKDLDWPNWMPYFSFCYNTSVHEATNYTPYELLFGKKCNLYTELSSKLQTLKPVYNFESYVSQLKIKMKKAHEEANERQRKLKEKRKEKWDENIIEKKISEGDLVLVRGEANHKLDRVFEGPFKVIKTEFPNAILDVKNRHVPIHVNRIKKYYEIINKIYLTLT
jgi:RNase H-like domain found in reverse transcriptase/Reverse transcriptase (RNA-dependent DNA polymerase)/Integrase zinc binding domain/Integrase core domain